MHQRHWRQSRSIELLQVAFQLCDNGGLLPLVQATHSPHVLLVLRHGRLCSDEQLGASAQESGPRSMLDAAYGEAGKRKVR